MTIPARPLHLACLACDPAEVYFSLNSLTGHLYRVHPAAMGLVNCARPGCGHGRGAHVPNRRSYCQAADPKPCNCPTFVEPEVSDVA